MLLGDYKETEFGIVSSSSQTFSAHESFKDLNINSN